MQAAAISTATTTTRPAVTSPQHAAHIEEHRTNDRAMYTTKELTKCTGPRGLGQVSRLKCR